MVYLIVWLVSYLSVSLYKTQTLEPTNCKRITKNVKFHCKVRENTQSINIECACKHVTNCKDIVT